MNYIRGGYLISLVVILRVIRKHLRLLGVIKGSHEIIGAKLLPPLLALNEPIPHINTPFFFCTWGVDVHSLGSLNIKLPSAQEP